MRVSPIIGRVSGGPTYDEFVAHITAMATGGVASWTGRVLVAGAYRTTAAASVGNMSGSSWMTVFRSSDNANGTSRPRAVLHGLPSITVMNALAAASSEVFVRFVDATAPSGFSAVDRNGFLSSANASTTPAMKMTELLYWLDGQAWKMQPDLGLGPTPYTW